MVDPKTRQPSEPRVCAGNDGTTITVGLVFLILGQVQISSAKDKRPFLQYPNAPSGSPQHLGGVFAYFRCDHQVCSSQSQCVLLMQKSALRVFSSYSPLADLFTQASSTTPEIATPASKTVQQAIRLLYGHSIATQLLEANISSKDERLPSEDEDEDEDAMDVDLPKGPMTWSAEVYFSNVNYQAKKMVFLLFINRLHCFHHSTVSRLTP